MKRTLRKVTNAARARIATEKAKRLEAALRSERSKPKDEFPNIRQLEVWLDQQHGFRGEVFGINIRVDPRSICHAIMRNNRDQFANISGHAAYIGHDLARQVEKLIVEAAQKDGLVGGYR